MIEKSRKYAIISIVIYMTDQNMTMKRAAAVCRAMGDDNRLRIIYMLQNGEMCACELLKELQITQPTLSHHMQVLHSCGLINIRQEGKWNHYSLNCSVFSQFKEYIGSLSCCSVKKEDRCL